MKKIFTFISFMTISLIILNQGNQSYVYGANSDDIVRIWCSSDLGDFTKDLVNSYKMKAPLVNIDIVEITNDEEGKMIKNPENIGFIRENAITGQDSESLWRIVVGRDIFVPVMNPDNPCADEIMEKGLSQDEFKALYTGTEVKDWGSLAGNNSSVLVNCWCMDGDSSVCCLADFLNVDKTAINSNKAKSSEEFLRMIGNDKYAIVFCKLRSVIDKDDELIDKRLQLVPIDLNGNNNIDHFENIYSNTNTLERGVWIGKYPKILFSNIFAVSNSGLSNPEERNFLLWLSTEGQKHINQLGYSGLIASERNSNIQKLSEEAETIAGIENRASGINIVLFIGIFLAAMIVIFLIISYFSYGKKEKSSGILIKSRMFGENSVKIPGGLFFDKSHTWVFMEKDGYVRTGIDDFLQHITGSITRIILKEPGEKIEKGETFIKLVQNGKQLEVKSPLSGTIIENNENLILNTAAINSSPYAEGWLYMVKPSNWKKAIRQFIMGDNYKEWLKNEFTRLKDFLAHNIRIREMEGLHTVLQEGGEIREGLLELFGPEVWEEFQDNFLNELK